MHRTTDPEVVVVVVEFAYAATRSNDGAAFEVPNIFVVRVRDGQIIESRDYGDHAGFARPFGPPEARAATR
ncbi:conserved hypothetical protein [Frankia canadensis]|uniref:SnoaL-like domain-containing protein n=1 Tax=Frankia canadensis TaxID=1836972 RepID=A0A2I2KK71_9ACTN|nr:hypothetical protein [Frankia canadensis]SNQ46072.1 conserved hypothetical protein [Frankia canadensis]SOU53362.1 conserved hypothetical protein [Frankia canadensis]